MGIINLQSYLILGPFLMTANRSDVYDEWAVRKMRFFPHELWYKPVLNFGNRNAEFEYNIQFFRVQEI